MALLTIINALFVVNVVLEFYMQVTQLSLHFTHAQSNSFLFQNYMRDQPDNIKSVNLIAETTLFLNMVYSNINSRTIDLAVQLFGSLNEFACGNQANRTVLTTHKVVDYINFILRAGDFKDCPNESVNNIGFNNFIN